MAFPDQMDEDDGVACPSGNYQLLFQMGLEWPCLSFDFLRDEHGSNRVFPHVASFVTATQAEEDEQDLLIVTNVSNLHKTQNDDDEEVDAALVNPTVNCCSGKHPGVTTRIRSMPQRQEVVATWCEDGGAVKIWDVSAAITKAITGEDTDSSVDGIFECNVQDVGYGLAWSRRVQGVLAIGQNSGAISVWADQQSAFTQMAVMSGHTDSVEDIVFSPTEGEIFASCSVDGSLALWDMRSPGAPAMRFTASDTDINVIDWNARQPSLIVSGDDNGLIRVWDLRGIQADVQPSPSGEISYYDAAVCSIEWNPFDEAEFSAVCEDGRVTIWDLSVEPEDMSQRVEGIPDQLMFEHFAEEPKEVHYHPQISGMLGVVGSAFDMFIPNIQTDEDPE